MNARNKALALLPAILMAGATALAAPYPELEAEQVNLDVAAGWTAVGASVQQQLAQSFEVARPGYISHVMLPMNCHPKADLRVTLEKTTGGKPDGTVLAYQELPGYLFDTLPTPAHGMRMIEISKPPLVGAGIYAVTLRVKGKADCIVLPGPPGDPYPGGKAWFIALGNPPGWFELHDDRDLAFQIFLRPL